MTPCIGTVNLYKTSGHWDHYRENMFPRSEEHTSELQSR